MTLNLLKLLLGLSAASATVPLAAGVPVHITGSTGADEQLMKDIVQTMTAYGELFHCAAPSEIRTSLLNASMVPDPLRKPSLHTAYEEWDADFCGKIQRFFVTYWPDPAGGSFLSVTYPYPPDAPTATFR